MKPLTEAQMRTLSRIAQRMRESATSKITLVLNDGGVRDYEESTRIQPKDMDRPDRELMENLA